MIVGSKQTRLGGIKLSKVNKRITLTDVAKATNSSVASVSRVLNDTDYPVSNELRQRIIDAAHRLNYYAMNYAAKNIKKEFVNGYRYNNS